MKEYQNLIESLTQNLEIDTEYHRILLNSIYGAFGSAYKKQSISEKRITTIDKILKKI